MEFDIREYMWDVFEISKVQDIDNANMALRMFMVNLEFGKERYRGSSYIDYRKLRKEWGSLIYTERSRQLLVASKLIEYMYPKLFDAWKENDKTKFSNVCYRDLNPYGVPSKPKASVKQKRKYTKRTNTPRKRRKPKISAIITA